MEATLVLEVLSASTGLGGALLLAIKSRHAPWAWLIWLVSNLGWVLFAMHHQHWGLAAQNAGFTITSATGVWVWLIHPYLTAQRRKRHAVNDGDQSHAAPAPIA